MLSNILDKLEARQSGSNFPTSNLQPKSDNDDYSFPINFDRVRTADLGSKKNLIMSKDEIKSLIDFSSKDATGNFLRPSSLNSRDVGKVREIGSNENSVLGLDLNKPEILDLIKKDTGDKGQNLQ